MSLFRRLKGRSIVTCLFAIIEKKPTSDRWLLRFLFLLFVISGILSLISLNSHHLITIPTTGGTLSEGIIGTPRFVNPILAVTRADHDISALIYSGLMKINSSGELVPDLAESVTLNEDGTIYNVIIRKDIAFHDGTLLTAKDVAFTISLIQDPTLKSPLLGNWIDIKIEEVNEYELNIILEEAYSPFIENFTLGILPKHIWGNLPIEQIPFSERNINPIGTGPFTIKTITKNKSGIIKSYLLSRFANNKNSANIANIKVLFYSNEDDLVQGYNDGQFHSSAYLPSNITYKLNETKKDTTILELPLPRIFVIFINQNHTPALRDSGARQALSTAINRADLVKNLLYNYGVPTTHPLPTSYFALESSSSTSTNETDVSIPDQAIAILEKTGWIKNSNGSWEKRIGGEITPLRVILQTTNLPLFEQIAQAIVKDWRAVGVDVQLEQFEQTDLLQNIIRPREYQTLLFGIEMSRRVDLYPFWHSSQREDPGLNISQYANIEVDNLLTIAKTTTDNEKRIQATNQASTIITNEYPAIFLFTPTTTYVTPNNVSTSPITRINRPHERFMNIEDWYINTDNVWPLFQ